MNQRAEIDIVLIQKTATRKSLERLGVELTQKTFSQLTLTQIKDILRAVKGILNA